MLDIDPAEILSVKKSPKLKDNTDIMLFMFILSTSTWNVCLDHHNFIDGKIAELVILQLESDIESC